jgi:hypothetical protein
MPIYRTPQLEIAQLVADEVGRQSGKHDIMVAACRLGSWGTFAFLNKTDMDRREKYERIGYISTMATGQLIVHLALQGEYEYLDWEQIPAPKEYNREHNVNAFRTYLPPGSHKEAAQLITHFLITGGRPEK